MNTIPFPKLPERGSLRDELAAAIVIHADVEARAAEGAAIAAKASRLAAQAADHVERLRTTQEQAARRAADAQARAISDALRHGLEPPPAPALPQEDFAAAAWARASFQALEASARELSNEAAEANAKAADAYGAVNRLARAIVAAEAQDLAYEVIGHIELHWAAFDKLAGFILLDEASGNPALQDLGSDVVAKISRRKRAIAENALYVEQHNYDHYIDGLAVAQQRKWNDYLRRLATDAEARFDE